MAEDIEEFRELWSGPESGWTLHRSYTVRHKLFVLLGPTPVTVSQLRALRMLPGPLQEVPHRDLKRAIPADGRVLIGEFYGHLVRDVAAKVKHLGLRFEVESLVLDFYLPVNSKTGRSWLIKDAETARRVAERMMAAGMPVVLAEE
ncbi:hypothetical protein [Pyxidicoccus xibeiensis]|uniref:hypothetical protein n=1 Tax=Pyxidicoccus xibeiensis TaxID=2906759 RepID=UPI0020A72860|nr:hypothetical protein [Pyxidicoccus xibeiensis]MCP3140547.1 hypothetical protein [Pyxidicoccus xibeiensis]